MDEKIIIKGVFSKLSILLIVLCGFALLGFVFIITSGSNDVDTASSIGIGLTLIFVSLGLAYLVYYLMHKCEITVTDKRVYGKAAFGKRVDLPFDKISAVSMCAFKGIGVSTSSGQIKFLFCKNKNDVFKAISNLLINRQDNQVKQPEKAIIQEMPQSNADELKKYKELLDSGVITQEEFDAKKKQLLDL